MKQYTVYVEKVKDAVEYYQSVFGLAIEEPNKEEHKAVLCSQQDDTIKLVLIEEEQAQSRTALNHANSAIELKTTQFWQDYHAFSAYGVVFETLPVEQETQTSVSFLDAYSVPWKLVH